MQNEYRFEGTSMDMTFHLLHAGYVLALLWYLSRTGPSLQALPDVDPVVLPRWRFGRWIPALVIALVFVSVAAFDDGTDILLQLMMVATVWVLVAWRREIRFSWVLQGLSLGLLALLVGIPMKNHGVINETVFYLLPLFVPPMYVAGGLLFDRTRFGGIQLRAHGPVKALKSFFWGCLLFLPLGIFNVADGPMDFDVGWVPEWWMPLALPWFSGIAEEAWFRLFLMGLCFFLLRPAFRFGPAPAVVATVLFSGITFGLGHGRDMETFLTTGLLYGVPMAAVFARRDWEHAVGAHYIINMLPWVAAFLAT